MTKERASSPLHIPKTVCRRREITMSCSEPLTPRLVEKYRAQWSIFLYDRSDVSAEREYCQGPERSGCGTIPPMLEMTLPPRFKASLAQEGA